MSFGFGFDDRNVHATPVHPRLFPNLPLTALGGLETGIRTSGRVRQMERLRPSVFAASGRATRYGACTAQRGDVSPLGLRCRTRTRLRTRKALPASSPKLSQSFYSPSANVGQQSNKQGAGCGQRRRGSRRVSTSTCLFHRRPVGQNSSWGEVLCRRSDMSRTRLA
jgi:hypothetical protein